MRKLHFFSTLVALVFATTSLWAKPAAADANGKLPGAFTINSNCDMVYFSQGNLQYTKSTNTWSFMNQQYDRVEVKDQNVGEDNANQDVISLFGWGTKDNPWTTNNNGSNYTWHEWGENSISNGGGTTQGWRTLSQSEWYYIIQQRSNASNLRTIATVHGGLGLILLPDNWTIEESGIEALVMSNSNKNVSDEDWIILENEGAVFLPAAGYRPSWLIVQNTNYWGYYWSRSPYSSGTSRGIAFYSGFSDPTKSTSSYDGWSVRLVKDVPSSERQALLPKASFISAPTAKEGLVYNKTYQDLINAGSAPYGYQIRYARGDSYGSIPSAQNAGNYIVKYYVHSNNTCFRHSDTLSLNVTISQADLDLSGLTITANVLPYDGNLHPLLTKTGSVSNATIYYSTDGVNWDPSIPEARNAGDYPVWYKVEPTDAVNYKTVVVEQLASITVPSVTDLSDASTINAVLALNPTDLMVERTIYADGEYNTICLPFAVSASDLANDQYPLYGYERLKTLKGAKVTGSGKDLSIDIFVEDVDHMDAGVPYLITYPAGSDNIENPVFHFASAPTYLTAPLNVSVDGVTFQGMFAQVHIDPYTNERDRDYLFLGANSQLMWPKNDDVSFMRGFRAYFIVDRTVITPAAAPSGTRARFVNAPKQPTAIENTELNTKVQKLLENGQLIILKNGIKYNAQGQVLK